MNKFKILNLKFKIDKGFTLIELLVVISIIGVLSALLMANISGIRERARDAKRKADLREVKTALKLYFNDHDSYPQAEDGAIKGCGDGDTPEECEWGSEFIRKETTYMKELPLDPINTDPNLYTYFYIDKDNFRIKAVLENKSDSDISKSQSLCGISEEGDTTNYYVCAD